MSAFLNRPGLQGPPQRDRGDARATVVNRAHRVVRAEAVQLREQRSRRRSLWVPVLLCSSLLLVALYASWALFDGYDLTPNGVPDASDQLFLLLLWVLPATALAVCGVWWRRSAAGLNGVRASEGRP